jgi:hypothetical protein
MIAALGLTAFAPSSWLSSAHAAITSSSTSVVATPNPATVGQDVALTATVGVPPVGGAIVTPTGPVTFSVGSTTLGSAPLGPCFLSACSATLHTTALPRGTDTVTARYGGDGYAAPSSGTVSVEVRQVATESAPYVTTCPAHTPCDSGTVYADDGSASLDVMATPSNSTDTITTALGAGALPCTTPNTGEVGDYTVSATDVNKTITYKIYGNAADAFNSAHPTTPPPHLCYFATLPFNGYYAANGHWTGTASDYAGGVHPVPYNSSLHGYYGLLPQCNATKSNSPCVVSQAFAAGSGGAPDQVTWVVYEAFRQKCDPHISG